MTGVRRQEPLVTKHSHGEQRAPIKHTRAGPRPANPLRDERAEMLDGQTRRLHSAVAARARIDQLRGAEPRSAVALLDEWLAPFRAR